MITIAVPAPAGRGARRPRVAFTTSPYRASHGHEPRGRGSWIFCPMNRYRHPDYIDHCACVAGQVTLTEAKRAAAVHFGEEYDYVVVCP